MLDWQKLYSRFRIYHLYYVLAGFDIAMLALSLTINHSNLKTFQVSNDLNREYLESYESAEKLSELAALTNAPGNDVFDSHDVAKERGRLKIATDNYKAYFANILSQAKRLDHKNQVNEVSLSENSQRDKMVQILEQVDLSMDNMLMVAHSIYEDFEKKDAVSAGKKMATMDQKFAILNSNLSEFRKYLNQTHSINLKAQTAYLQRSSSFEEILGWIIVFMVFLVAWFGHKMSARAEVQDNLLRESSKMVALGEMAGGIAHEINNPLAIIRTKASQLRRLISSGRFENTQGITYLQEIENTTIRISKIVDGLRTFSRSGAGESMVPIRIDQILNDVQGLCQERLQGKGIEFRIINSTDVITHCQPVQIEQVIVNLVNNSVDAIYTTEKPWVTVEVQTTDDQIKILVTDSGNGIPAQIAEKMTQPFFTTKPVGKGTGLGLSISVGIAEQHGGSLKLNRQCPNTQFILTLPRNKTINRIQASAA